MRSEDDGSSYTIVDNSLWEENQNYLTMYMELIYMVYRMSTIIQLILIHQRFMFQTIMGTRFTWRTLVVQDGKAWFTIDENNSGVNYYSSGKKIFKSIKFWTNI